MPPFALKENLHELRLCLVRVRFALRRFLAREVLRRLPVMGSEDGNES